MPDRVLPRFCLFFLGALIGIGDKNGDKRIAFDEYVHMSHDAFVNNIAPRTLKRVLRQ